MQRLRPVLFSTQAQVRISWVLLAVAIVGWPMSALTWARDEPQFILGLSWFALILGSYNTLLTAYVNKEVKVQAQRADVEAEQVNVTTNGGPHGTP